MGEAQHIYAPDLDMTDSQDLHLHYRLTHLSPMDVVIKLKFGDGNLHIYPNLLSEADTDQYMSNLQAQENLRFYRQYKANQKEPRYHITVSESEGYGYVYAGKSVQMRGLSPAEIPFLRGIFETVQRGGVVPDNSNQILFMNVVYMCGKQYHINWHADNNQGEANVLSVVVQSEGRVVELRSNSQDKNGNERPTQETIALYLNKGDAYMMCGDIQEHYQHRVPMMAECRKYSNVWPAIKHAAESAPESARVSFVFRSIDRRKVRNDSGIPVESLIPKEKKKHYVGQHPSIEEGALHKRVRLCEMGVHRMNDKGVSGDQKDGADAIVISSQDKTKREEDRFVRFLYTSSKKQGALAQMKSFVNGSVVRVFRSYNATKYGSAGGKENRLYRYDGLYRILQAIDENGNPCRNWQSPNKDAQYTFLYERVETGEGRYTNRRSNTEMYNIYLRQEDLQDLTGAGIPSGPGDIISGRKLTSLPEECLRQFNVSKLGIIPLEMSDSRKKGEKGQSRKK